MNSSVCLLFHKSNPSRNSRRFDKQRIIAALRQFICRRGHCSIIYSDNRTNFVRNQRELASYLKGVDSTMARNGIEWKFNPPSAPHFSGLWESAVNSMIHHLSRILTETKLNIGELNTHLCQIETCLNSRPITPMSSDPGEPEALTPAHFLIECPIFLSPELNKTEENSNCIRRWRYVQFLMQTFWKSIWKQSICLNNKQEES